jgi:hypothetical protein
MEDNLPANFAQQRPQRRMGMEGFHPPASSPSELHFRMSDWSAFYRLIASQHQFIY